MLLMAKKQAKDEARQVKEVGYNVRFDDSRLLDAIRQRAKAGRRSINSEILLILEEKMRELDSWPPPD